MLVDETLHGYLQRPSLGRELTRFPLVLALVQGVLLVLAVLWASLGRFGPPLPLNEGERSAQREMIETSASLLDTSVHRAQNLNRYFFQKVREVALGLGVPSVRSQSELIDWLTRVGEERGVSLSVRELGESVHALTLELKVDSEDAQELASSIWNWREEMMHGS